MSKRTIKINIKLPAGVFATKQLTDEATQAAKAVVDASLAEISEAAKLAKELAKKGIQITAEEILERKTSPVKSSAAKPARKKSASKRTRVVLDDAQKSALVEDLKNGAKVAAAAAKYGISTATVMNIKTAAGLTKSRK